MAGTITGARLMHSPVCQDCPAGPQVQTAREFPQELKGEMSRSIVFYLRISNKHTLLLISYSNKKSLRLKSFRGFYCFPQCSLFCTCSVFNCCVPTSRGGSRGKGIFCAEQLESTSAPHIPGEGPALSSGLNIFRGVDTILISTYKFI